MALFPTVTDNSITGGKHQVIETVNRSVGQYLRHNPGNFYIGITAQDVEKRYDEYKKEIGTSKMIILYTTSSLENARAVEKSLTDKYLDPFSPCKNRRSGGGGRPPLNAKSYHVYLAMEEQSSPSQMANMSQGFSTCDTAPTFQPYPIHPYGAFNFTGYNSYPFINPMSGIEAQFNMEAQQDRARAQAMLTYADYIMNGCWDIPGFIHFR